MRIAVAQINTTAGDINGNLEKAHDAYGKAWEGGADLVVFPELTITGYPPEDLLLRQDFLRAAMEALDEFISLTGDCTAIIGVPYLMPPALRPYNAAVVASGAGMTGLYFKEHLPNYGVFDEERYFEMGRANPRTITIAGIEVGVSICEDAWVPDSPIFRQAPGAELLVNISASPYHAGRILDREVLLQGIVRKTGLPLVYANLVGGQDELVFDGGSLIFNKKGDVHSRAAQFHEEVHVTSLAIDGNDKPGWGVVNDRLSPVEEVYEALVLGTHDYVVKNGYTKVLLGLSGGIDSSLVAAVAADALGAENVMGVMMPSRFSSEGSLTDAQQLAEALGILTRTIPIESTHAAMEDTLRLAFPTEWGITGVTEENIQARTRGMILMAISNKFGGMVLTTGNKSEMAMGYATLYGDMAGGFAVIKDVPKTLVYQLCEYVNERYGREVIPKTVITKAPSAELRFGQKDSDSLPEYDVLDPIIQMYVNGDHSPSEIVTMGFDREIVSRVTKAIDRNEYKRRQSPLGIRISPKAFGKDRRLPIANGWHG